jgi:predicted PurR-regulated permease PerM
MGVRNARTLLERPIPPSAINAIVPASPIGSLDPVDEVEPINNLHTNIAKWTLRRDIPLALLAWTGVVLLIGWLASHVISTIFVLVIAALLAYALAPLVGMLGRFMPRALAIIIVYVVVLTGLGALLYLVVRSAVDQVTTLTHSVSTLITPARPGQITPLERLLESFGMSASQIDSLRTQALNQLGGVASSILPILSGVAGTLLDFLLVIILSIYALIEGSKVTAWLQNEMPRGQRGRVRFLLHTLQRIVGGYIRGQLIMSSLIGVLVGVGMLIIGVPYALLLGVLAFILEFIPILGTLLSGVICVLMALTKGWVLALIVLVYFILVHIFEGDIVGPRIVGKAVGLHPMVAMVALIAGSELFGIPGALFASPVAGVLQALIVTLWFEWQEAHPDDFHTMKRQVTDALSQHTADHTLSPGDPDKDDVEEKLLS